MSPFYGLKSSSGNIWIALIDSHTHSGFTSNWSVVSASPYTR